MLLVLWLVDIDSLLFVVYVIILVPVKNFLLEDESYKLFYLINFYLLNGFSYSSSIYYSGISPEFYRVVVWLYNKNKNPILLLLLLLSLFELEF
jgi:hypothetical protein